jgi:hypothetical protein
VERRRNLVCSSWRRAQSVFPVLCDGHLAAPPPWVGSRLRTVRVQMTRVERPAAAEARPAAQPPDGEEVARRVIQSVTVGRQVATQFGQAVEEVPKSTLASYSG